ncbi:hypothetical protein MMC25_001212 [Agyrium rufum]|nr:hypothetical protein [Agyrium rufum]
MAPPSGQAVAPAQRGAPAQQKQGSSTTDFIKSAVQGIIIFFAAQMLIGRFFGNKTDSPAGPVPDFSDKSMDAQGNYNPIPQSIAPIWPANSSLDLSIYVSPTMVKPILSKMGSETLLLQEKGFRLGDYKDSRDVDITFDVPKESQNSGMLWAHFFVALANHTLDPSVSDYNIASAYHFFRPLVQVLPKKKIVKTKHLLGNANETEEVGEVEDSTPGRKLASYYHPNFTMSFIPDSGTQSYTTMHPAIRQFVTLEPTGARDSTGQNGWYYPTMYVNTFWQLRSHMTELNSTVKTLPLRITLNNLANWKFSLYASIDEGVKQNQRQVAEGGPVPAGGDGSEFEMFKSILIDTNVYLLATTGIVSIFHMIFEGLAFKSDISHWRNKKDNVGISVRTILANVFMQTVILLYLVDNREGTSWMILGGQGLGIVLEAWKITKTVDVRVRPADADSMLPYKITFEDKHKLSDTEKKTQEYDAIAFRYMYIVAIPLLLAYAVYSVLYDTHKSWYSFVITTLVGSVYAYGFLMMVPSLYINYRLKKQEEPKLITDLQPQQSVAHLPAKAMTYKFLNTFIDDLFAFTIKMPTLHRLATLRDDVIFFVYLYQAWAYKVDYTRVNEFGQGGGDEELEEKIANKPLVGSAGADAGQKVGGVGETEGLEEVTGLIGEKVKKSSGVEKVKDGVGAKRRK